MGTNVFGSAVTNATLETMPEFEGKTITRNDRAEVALERIRSENKAANAQVFLDNLKRNYGNGVSTKCLIYNATGDPLSFVRSHDWHGHIGASPHPREIANGQWGAFFHVKPSAAAVGSWGAVVYRTPGHSGSGDRDIMTAWGTAWGPRNTNSAYAEIRARGHFTNNRFTAIGDEMNRRDIYNLETSNPFKVEQAMGGDTTVYWESVITLNR